MIDYEGFRKPLRRLNNIRGALNQGHIFIAPWMGEASWWFPGLFRLEAK